MVLNHPMRGEKPPLIQKEKNMETTYDQPDYFEVRANITLKTKEMMIRQLNLNLQPHEIDNDGPLFGLGLSLDSVDALELIIGLEQEFGKFLKEEQKLVFRSVNTIVDFIM